MESNLQLGKAFLAVAAFLAFVAWDVVMAYKSGDKWIQGSALTLSALTVQFLGYFDFQNVSLFGKSKEKDLEMLLSQQLSIDIARLVFCTFLGCVLPGVAFNGSAGRWSSIAAVAVSLCFHMATELYAVLNVHGSTFRNGGVMFISSSVLLFVAAVSLVLYIGLAIINCKFARDRLSIRIPIILSGKIKAKMLDENEGEIFRWWAIVRGCQQEFWLVSSALTPAVLLIVTTCVAVVVAKVISQPSLFHPSNTSVTWSFCLQCIFILTGWIILIWRWLKFLVVRLSIDDEVFTYIDSIIAYEIRLCRSVYLFILRKLNVRALHNVPASHFKCILMIMRKVWRILAFFFFLTLILPMSLLVVVICLLMLFHRLCWGLSGFLGWIAINVAHAIPRFKILGADAQLKLSTEVRIDTETGEYLYVAESSNQKTRRVMKEAYDKGQNSLEVLVVIKLSTDESRKVIRDQLSHIDNKYVYEHQGVWKMSAVTAISIIAELAHDRDWNEIVKDVVQAYWEAQDLLEFIDFTDNITVNPVNLFDSGNSRAFQMSLEADIKMQEIESLVETKWQRHADLTFKDLAEVVKKIAEEDGKNIEVNSKFCRYWSGKEYIDSLVRHGEGSDYLKRFSMECVCKSIYKEFYSDERELMDRAVRCLGDIITSALLILPEVLSEYCKKWAEEFKEENLIRALEIQEKFRAVKEKWSSADSAVGTDAEENKLAEDTKVETERDMRHEIMDLEAR